MVTDMLAHYTQANKVMQVYKMMQLTGVRVWLRKMSLTTWLVITVDMPRARLRLLNARER